MTTKGEDLALATRRAFCPRPLEMGKLQSEFELISNADNCEPRVVALLAESGIGKTRLVQEFFAWLSANHQDGPDRRYWPESLDVNGDNLLIEVAPSSCNATHAVRFLWSAVRLLDPRRQNDAITLSVINACWANFESHVQDIFVGRREDQRKAESRRALKGLIIDGGLEAAASLVPGGGFLKSIYTTVWDGVKRRIESDEDQVLSPGDAHLKKLNSVTADFIDVLSELFESKRQKEIPLVFVIDDAQWAGRDPALLDFLDELLALAFKNKWPLLIVLTCWQREWNEFTDIRRVVEKYVDNDWAPTIMAKHPDLSAMAQAAFPGLTKSQAAALAVRADGNPLFLYQITAELRGQLGFFEQRDPTGALNETGFAFIKEHRFELLALIEKRLAEDEQVCTSLALSSIQGIRFRHELTQHLLSLLSVEWTAGEAIERAADPLAFVARIDERSSEFSQRLFFEAASRKLIHVVPDQDTFRNALAKAIVLFLDKDEREMASAGIEVENIAVAAFSGDANPERRIIAGIALLRICQGAHLHRQQQAASIAALRLLEGIQDGSWTIAQFDRYHLFTAIDALDNPIDRVEGRIFADLLLEQARRELRTCDHFTVWACQEIAQSATFRRALIAAAEQDKDKLNDLCHELFKFREAICVWDRHASKKAQLDSAKLLMWHANWYAKLGDVKLPQGDAASLSLNGMLRTQYLAAVNDSLRAIREIVQHVPDNQTWSVYIDLLRRAISLFEQAGDVDSRNRVWNEILTVQRAYIQEARSANAWYEFESILADAYRDLDNTDIGYEIAKERTAVARKLCEIERNDDNLVILSDSLENLLYFSLSAAEQLEVHKELCEIYERLLRSGRVRESTLELSLLSLGILATEQGDFKLGASVFHENWEKVYGHDDDDKVLLKEAAAHFMCEEYELAAKVYYGLYYD